MIHRGIVLYGPPASGKDSVTEALSALDPAYTLFRRLKVGDGRSAGYRMTSQFHLDGLRRRGMVVYLNERYGSVYIIDRPELDASFCRGEVPVVHIGQIAGIVAVLAYPAEWLTVRLWCSRQTAENRLRSRGAPDIAARLIAWDETLDDLARADDYGFGLVLDTESLPPYEAARRIDTLLTSEEPKQLR